MTPPRTDLVSTRQPSASARHATSRPMWPSPMTPTVWPPISPRTAPPTIGLQDHEDTGHPQRAVSMYSVRRRRKESSTSRKMRSRLAIEAVAAPLHEIPDVRLAVRRRREVHSALVLPQSSLSSDLQGDSHASDHAGPILCGCEGFNSGHSPRPATQSLSQQNRWQIEGQVHGGGVRSAPIAARARHRRAHAWEPARIIGGAAAISSGSGSTCRRHFLHHPMMSLTAAAIPRVHRWTAIGFHRMR